MGLFSFLRGDSLDGQSKALSGTPSVLEALNQRQFSPYPRLGGSNINTQRISGAYVSVQNASYGWLFSTQPAVRQVIEFIADNVAQLGLKVYERVSDKEREHRGDHPAAEAMRWPNSWTPGQQFIYEFVSDYLIFNNAYALKFPSPAGLTLVNVPAHMVGLIGRSFFTPEGYRIWDQDGTSFDFPPQRIVHWRGKNPADPRRGESKLETLREEIAADAAARQANTELHRSGLVMGGWVERPLEAPEISSEGLKRLRESLANQAQSSRREYPILEEGMKFQQGGVTPEDAELIAARHYTLERIAGIFGMKNCPPEGEEERRQFYADVLPPITERCAAFLDLHVLIAEYGADDHYYEFNLDEKRMSDDRIKTLVSAAGRPIFTADEARSYLDLPPKGADELATPLNLIIGDPPKPSNQVMPIQDPNKPPQDGSHRSGEAEQPQAAGSRASLNGHHKASLIPRRRMASERRDRWAKEYQGVLDRHFERQRRTLKSRKAKAFADERWNKELGNGLNDVAERQFEAEGAHVAFRLAFTFDPDQGENWLAAKSIGAAEAINRTTQQHADEADLDKAFEQAKGRVAGAGMAFATSVAAFSTKVATEQAPGEPTVTVYGGECDECAPFQGSWSASELEQWPAYHAHCECVVDVIGGVTKAITVETKAEPINMEPHFHIGLNVSEGALQIPVNVEPTNVNVEQPSTHIDFNVPEGAMQVLSPINVEPARVNVEQPSINVSPAEVEVHVDKGAVAPTFNVEAATPADIRFDKGAFAISNPINVEQAPPPDVRIEEGAIQVDVSSPNVNVEAPASPDVNVTVEPPAKTTKRVVRDEDGNIEEIVETRKQTVKRDPETNRIQSIEEEES